MLLLQLSSLVKLARQAAIVALKELLSAEVVAHLETSISIRRTRPFFWDEVQLYRLGREGVCRAIKKEVLLSKVFVILCPTFLKVDFLAFVSISKHLCHTSIQFYKRFRFLYRISKKKKSSSRIYFNNFSFEFVRGIIRIFRFISFPKDAFYITPKIPLQEL